MCKRRQKRTISRYDATQTAPVHQLQRADLMTAAPAAPSWLRASLECSHEQSSDAELHSAHKPTSPHIRTYPSRHAHTYPQSRPKSPTPLFICPIHQRDGRISRLFKETIDICDTWIKQQRTLRTVGKRNTATRGRRSQKARGSSMPPKRSRHNQA